MNLADKYDPKTVEEKWYSHWEEKSYFKSTPDEREAYTILMPPPNVTGILHMGHMLNNTVQDILIRKARLEGKNACWVPGLDHASIATEAKVVKLLREKGIKKSDLSRDEFLSHAWDWKEEYGGKILDQLKKLGTSCDWDRTRFTMDPELSEAVIHVFVDLYKKGKIYRAHRMTNWDPEAQTVLSNEEVIYQQEQSQLYYLRYKIEGSEEYILIATTRPETILGDTAVAVHPDDERYSKLKGKKLIVPLVNRSIPVVFDDYVDIEFGTGALKITPAHDMNDNAIGEKYNLEVIDIFTPKAKIAEGYGAYSGMDRFELRKKIAKDLDAAGLLEKKENYNNNVGRSERTNSVVEPRLTLQWFLKMDDMAAQALEAVKSGEVGFFPPHFVNMYENWLKEENVRDWCVSRQLWWGHQIPAWYYKDDYIVAKSEEEAVIKLQEKYAENFDRSLMKRDEDVVDTWFSSWLWPISVFNGFQDRTELEYYYPSNVLVTAWDIIFFWVARMIMAGYEWSPELISEQDKTKKQPFNHVYFTGMVRDNKRRKMSKSLGNSPDALELLKNYGADGVRFGILSSAAAGNDIIFDAPIDPKTGEVLNESKLCEQGSKFANKLWQATRLIMSWPEKAESDEIESSDKLAIEWINQLFLQHLAELEKSYAQYRLSEVVMNSYNFIWGQFCSWYLEMIKPEYQGAIHPKTKSASIDIFEKILISLHPIMPFITEEIWHVIRQRGESEDIIVSKMPEVRDQDKSIIQDISLVQDVISKIRDLRQQFAISKADPLILISADEGFRAKMNERNGSWETLKKMAVLSEIIEEKPDGVQGVEFSVSIYKFELPIEQKVDWEAELEKVEEEIKYQEGFLNIVDKKLSNDRFVNNAPEAVVNNERKKRDDAVIKIENLRKNLKRIKENIKA